jgi:hypothetical protein
MDVEKQSLIGSERKEYDSIEAPKSRYGIAQGE